MPQTHHLFSLIVSESIFVHNKCNTSCRSTGSLSRNKQLALPRLTVSWWGQAKKHDPPRARGLACDSGEQHTSLFIIMQHWEDAQHHNVGNATTATRFFGEDTLQSCAPSAYLGTTTQDKSLAKNTQNKKHKNKKLQQRKRRTVESSHSSVALHCKTNFIKSKNVQRRVGYCNASKRLLLEGKAGGEAADPRGLRLVLIVVLGQRAGGRAGTRRLPSCSSNPWQQQTRPRPRRQPCRDTPL